MIPIIYNTEIQRSINTELMMRISGWFSNPWHCKNNNSNNNDNNDNKIPINKREGFLTTNFSYPWKNCETVKAYIHTNI